MRLKAPFIDRDIGPAWADNGSPEQNQGIQSNQAAIPVPRNKSVNNWGSGTQFNNQGGNQNVATTGGTLIVGSTFNGEVHFGIKKEEFQGKIITLQKISNVAINSNIPQLNS